MPGKNLGTKGAGPDMWGVSSEASVWRELLSCRSRRAARARRRIMLMASPRAMMLSKPTLPPIAAANVTTLLFPAFLEECAVGLVIRIPVTSKGGVGYGFAKIK